MAEPLLVVGPFAARRGGRPRRGDTSWWSRAWVRSLEEAASDAAVLPQARTLARSGRLGELVLTPGSAACLVESRDGAARHTELAVATLADGDWAVVVDQVARASGHVADLAAGVLDPELVEECDELGVELLPGAADLEAGCSCGATRMPCRHALALGYQLGWVLEDDPFALLLLRGRDRSRLLAEVSEVAAAAAAVTAPRPDAPEPDPAASSAELADAGERARRIIALADDAPAGHGLADSRVAAYDEEVGRLLPE